MSPIRANVRVPPSDLCSIVSWCVVIVMCSDSGMLVVVKCLWYPSGSDSASGSGMLVVVSLVRQ